MKKNNLPKKPPDTKARESDEAQSRRFIDAAIELEVDESGKAFNRALDSVIPTKETPPKKSPKK